METSIIRSCRVSSKGIFHLRTMSKDRLEQALAISKREGFKYFSELIRHLLNEYINAHHEQLGEPVEIVQGGDTKKVLIAFEVNHLKQLDQFAKQQGLTRSEVVRAATRQYLRDNYKVVAHDS